MKKHSFSIRLIISGLSLLLASPYCLASDWGSTLGSNCQITDSHNWPEVKKDEYLNASRMDGYFVDAGSWYKQNKIQNTNWWTSDKQLVNIYAWLLLDKSQIDDSKIVFTSALPSEFLVQLTLEKNEKFLDGFLGSQHLQIIHHTDGSLSYQKDQLPKDFSFRCNLN